MKQPFQYFFFIFLSIFLIIGPCSCQSFNKKSENIAKQSRVFNKKPVLDTLLNEFATPIGYVNDYAGLFTPDQIYEMDSLIYDFETKTSIQLILVTFDSLMVKASEIDDVTAAIGNGWKVGGDSSKGSVIGISKAYKSMRIQNGKYIQNILSDSQTKEIIDSNFIPEFRNDRYYEGTISGLRALINILLISLAEKSKIEF